MSDRERVGKGKESLLSLPLPTLSLSLITYLSSITISLSSPYLLSLLSLPLPTLSLSLPIPLTIPRTLSSTTMLDDCM